MVRSMTGFGRSQSNVPGYQSTCEVRGVNHRFLDSHIRISRRYSAIEDKIREEIKKYVNRGRIEININIEKTGESQRNIKLDKDLAMAYHNSLKELEENLNISSHLGIMDIFGLPGVFSLEDQEEDQEMLWALVQASLDGAMDSLIEMRSKEGRNLADDILERNQLILAMVEKLEKRAPIVSKDYYGRLRKRISELLPQEIIDEQRITQEAAIFADKSSITEEIVRLKSHVAHLHELMTIGGLIGRKCDFLLQEMFREINTIASKANDLEMSRIVVEAKAELEKIREQVQNIE